MPNKKFDDPAERLDLAYLFANISREDIHKLAHTAREIVPGVSARCAMVHVAHVAALVKKLQGTSVRPEVVIDFPDGSGGLYAKQAEAFAASKAGAIGADIVVNMRHVIERDWESLLAECTVVRKYLDGVKLICQIPYLWHFDKGAIPWLIDYAMRAGLSAVKDWTTRQNFSLPVGKTLDTSVETRLLYTEYMVGYIVRNNLPLVLKIAGGVDASNAKKFVDAGADLLGISYGKAASVREALL